MSDEDLSELEELVGEWADAASKDAVEEDLLALDTLADEWAHKAGALDLDAGSDQDAALVVSAEMDTSAPPDEIILDEELDELEDDLSVDEDWAGRAAVTVPEPPAPDEPITLPKRPDPVTLPPLPSGNLSDAAKQGDRRYASPIEPPLPGPKSDGAGRQRHPASARTSRGIKSQKQRQTKTRHPPRPSPQAPLPLAQRLWPVRRPWPRARAAHQQKSRIPQNPRNLSPCQSRRHRRKSLA